MILLAGRPQVLIGHQAQIHPPTYHPLKTLSSHPGKGTSHLSPIPEWLESYMCWLLLNLIYVTYTNAYILLTWNMEDGNNFICCKCHTLDPHLAEDEELIEKWVCS